MDQQIAKALRLCLDQRSNVAAACEQNIRSRLYQIHDRESDKQRDRGDDLEIQQRFRAHAPDFLQITATGNADDERRKNQRRNDRLDQVKKNVAQEIDIVAPLRTDVTEHPTEHEADENLRSQ